MRPECLCCARCSLTASRRKYYVYDANAEEWISILKLAHTWKFFEVKRMATRYLEDFVLDPVRKIELYQWYELDKRLLIPSYVALITRLEPLSLDEGRRLSLETALLLATARECARGRLESGRHSPITPTIKTEAMVDIIKQVFGIADSTPTSPSLEPIAEGRGPSAFTATPLSPSKINTAPPPRSGAMSPTPVSRSNGSAQPLTSLATPTTQSTTPAAPATTTPPVTSTTSNGTKPAAPPLASAPSKDPKTVPQTPIAPEVPAYLQTTFGAPSTPIKSAPSSGLPKAADVFGLPDPSAAASKTGQSSVVRPSPAAARARADTWDLQAPTERTPQKATRTRRELSRLQTGETPPPTPPPKKTTAPDPAPPPAPATTRTASTPSGPTRPAKTRASAALVSVEGTTATTKATKGGTAGEGKEDETAEDAASSSGSSGYHTDITNSADEAAAAAAAGSVVGNECDDFATSDGALRREAERSGSAAGECPLRRGCIRDRPES